MTSPLERSYRRLLRLLPAAYRRRWEDDMVTAFLQSAEDSGVARPTVAERLSVVGLAVRLRLSGSHAAPRWALWYQVVHAVALLVLLYQAVAATTSTGRTVVLIYQLPVVENSLPWYESDLLWSRFVGLLWVPAFVCYVLRRFTAARVWALLAVAAAIGITVVSVAAHGPYALYGLGGLSRWGWLAVSAAVVLVAPPKARASWRLWFGTYAIGSVVVFLVSLRAFVPLMAQYWEWLQFGDLEDLSTVALIVALTAILAHDWVVRRASAHWLIALSVVAGGIGGMRVARSFGRIVPPLGDPAPLSPSTVLATGLLGLAAVGLIVGLVAGLYEPRRPGAGDTAR